MSEERSKLPVAASLVLMLGASSLLAGLTDVSVWSIPLVVVGTAVTIPALRRITPPGTLTARRGLPAASAAFFAIDGFRPADAGGDARAFDRGGRHRDHGVRARLGRRLVVAVGG